MHYLAIQIISTTKNNKNKNNKHGEKNQMPSLTITKNNFTSDLNESIQASERVNLAQVLTYSRSHST